MQVVADFSVDGSSGALAQQDYFEPFDYQNLNGGDRDFGSSGVSLLDPSVFSGGGVKRLAVAAGKNGKVRKEAQMPGELKRDMMELDSDLRCRIRSMSWMPITSVDLRMVGPQLN